MEGEMARPRGSEDIRHSKKLLVAGAGGCDRGILETLEEKFQRMKKPRISIQGSSDRLTLFA
jgi:hypothetical protein